MSCQALRSPVQEVSDWEDGRRGTHDLMHGSEALEHGAEDEGERDQNGPVVLSSGLTL